MAQAPKKMSRTLRAALIVLALIILSILGAAYGSAVNVTWFHGILHEENTIGQFLFISVLLGGWAAWMTGRACAQTWRPYPALIAYLFGLGIGIRFIHHALFEGTMFSPQYYVVDTIVLLIFGTIGYRFTRTNQMVSQYHWLYERASLLSWKEKTS